MLTRTIRQAFCIHDTVRVSTPGDTLTLYRQCLKCGAELCPTSWDYRNDWLRHIMRVKKRVESGDLSAEVRKEVINELKSIY